MKKTRVRSLVSTAPFSATNSKKEKNVPVQNGPDPGDAYGAVALVSAASGVTMFGLNISEIGVIVSAIVAVVSCALHAWCALRKDRREREIYKRCLEQYDFDDPPK